MPGDRLSLSLGSVLAALWLVVLVAADVVTARPTFALAPLFALSPLIACAVLSARATSGFAIAAACSAVASGSWNGTSGTAQQTIRIVDVALIGVAAVIIASVRASREQRYQRVVAIADVAQRTILPTVPPVVHQVAVGVRYLSAAEDAVVGGDLYDCYHSQARTRFLIGDVRGKGVAAVEQAARVIRAFRQSAATQESLPAVAEEMDAYLTPFFDDEEFVTAVLLDVSDPSSLLVVSCGHPPPMLITSEGPRTLSEAPSGRPLGLGGHYEALPVPWSKGQRLLMYTDGLSEARDARGEFLPLADLWPLANAGTIDEALDRVVEAVRKHVPGGHLADDLAVMLLENLAPLSRPSYGALHPDAAVGPEHHKLRPG